MSKRKQDDLREQRRIDAIAEGAGLTPEEVRRWVVNDYPEKSSHGLAYGHVIEIAEDAPAELIRRLEGTSVSIGPLWLDDDS